LALVGVTVGAVVLKQSHTDPVEKPVVAVVNPPVNPPPVNPPPVNPPPNPVAEKKTGRLGLSTNAMTTRVFLDPTPAEKSPVPVAAGGMSFKVEVPAGRIWTLRVEADGYNTVTVPLVIGAGEETSMPVMLTPSTAAPPPPRGNTSGGRPRVKRTDPIPQ